jgi:hypothetical protein
MAPALVWPFPTQTAGQYQRVDQGWDLQGPIGPVLAAASGTVQYAHDPAGFGNTYPVLILDQPDANGVGIYYGHVVPTVPAGTHVAAGAQIATTANGPQGNASSPGWLEIGWWGPNGPTGNGAAMQSALSGSTIDRAATNVAGAAGGGGQAPSMADIPALDAYIKQNYPDQAWMLAVPEVRQVVEKAVVAQETPAQVQADLQQTSWWKHTAQSMITYQNMLHSTPEELNFGDPGSKASAALATAHSAAAGMGLGLPLTVLKSVALEALKYGWNDTQVTQKLGSLAWVHTAAGGGVTSNDPQMLAQLTHMAGRYLYNPDANVLNSYAQAIAAGTMTMDAFQAFLAAHTAQKYPSLGDQIRAGNAPGDIVDPLRQEVARIMEINPNAVNFVSDPFYAKILNYTPPPVAGKAQAPRVMTTSELDAYLRNSSQYAASQNARDSAGAMSKSIVTAFGKVAS